MEGKGLPTKYYLRINGLDHIIVSTLKHFTFLFMYWGVKHLFEITRSKFLICSNMGIFSQITYLTFWIVLSIEEFSVHPHHKDMSDRDSSVHLSRRPWFVSYAMYF